MADNQRQKLDIFYLAALATILALIFQVYQSNNNSHQQQQNSNVISDTTKK
jgi:hypothetical protein